MRKYYYRFKVHLELLFRRNTKKKLLNLFKKLTHKNYPLNLIPVYRVRDNTHPKII